MQKSDTVDSIEPIPSQWRMLILKMFLLIALNEEENVWRWSWNASRNRICSKKKLKLLNRNYEAQIPWGTMKNKDGKQWWAKYQPKNYQQEPLKLPSFAKCRVLSTARISLKGIQWTLFVEYSSQVDAICDAIAFSLGEHHLDGEEQTMANNLLVITYYS